jgi:phosphatidate cytidylyltransferase
MTPMTPTPPETTSLFRQRFLDYPHAFDHPVSRVIVAATGALLLFAPLLIHALRLAGLSDEKLHADLRQRYRSWLVLAPAMILPILAGPMWTILAVGVLALLCFREFARATGLFREHRIVAVAGLGIVAVIFAAADHWYGLFVAAFPLTCILIAAVAITEDRPKGYIQRVGLGIFGFMFFGACLGHLAYFANDRDYRPILLMLLMTVELNDVFAYIAGKTFGRRKLAPETSPNKTIAGGLGSILITTPLVAVLSHYIFLGTAIDTPALLVLLGLIVAAGGQLGDLMLSSVKRDVGVKDLGTIIPGHGGFLDRFDSLILVAPAVFHFVGYFNGIGLDMPVRIITAPLGGA